MRIRLTRCVIALLAIGTPGMTALADDKFELPDDELAHVTAGTQTDAEELLTFDFVRKTQSGKTISGEGSIETLVALMATATPTLFLGDGAQGHLSSLVNINAVNSQINVLLNLNISIDSSIGSLNQLNINAARPVDLLPSH
jgi:hypothetical protein